MYDVMFQYVEDYLKNNDVEASKMGHFPFRKRSEHIKRVFLWAQRLAECCTTINKEVLFTAAIFHDVGYATAIDNNKHAEESAIICKNYLIKNESAKEYLKKYEFASDFIEKVVYLVQNHSNKELMQEKDTPLELILLMEADLLDETGALSIIWDSMMEGNEKVQSFEKTYQHILRYSCKQMNHNPMITAKAKTYWERKQNLIGEFVKHLSYDLGIQE